MLIMDEADLLFSYGYRDDVVSLCALLPRVRQTVLMVSGVKVGGLLETEQHLLFESLLYLGSVC